MGELDLHKNAPFCSTTGWKMWNISELHSTKFNVQKQGCTEHFWAFITLHCWAVDCKTVYHRM